MTQKRTVRFGILGASRIAQKSVLPAFADSSCAEVLIVGSRSPERQNDFLCPAGSYENVLAADIDAVYISLPNSMHEEWTIKALEAGKHVWCEKPAALSYESAQRMVAAAQKANKRLMEGFMFLRHPQHAKVRELIENREIGNVVGFSGAISFPRPSEDNIRLSKDLGGGVYYDACVYPIRASRMIFGEEPISVQSTFVVDKKSGVDTRADLTLEYSGGRSAKISASFDEEVYRSTYTVIGRGGTIEMERAYAMPPNLIVHVSVRKANKATEYAFGPINQFQLMIDEFCSEIRSENKTKDYEGDLLAQARIIEACLRAAREKRTVHLSEVS